MKKKLDCIVLFALAVFLATVFVASIGNGGTILEDFEDGTPILDWSTNQTSTTPSGQTFSTTPSGQTFLGPFGAETVTVVIKPMAGYHSVYVDFDVYAIVDWLASGPAPWIVWQVPSSDDDARHLFAASYLSSHLKRTETDTLGYPEPDRVYHFRQPLVGYGEDWYRLEFEGIGNDISWGLDNVEVATGVPEPSTGKTLLIVGLLLLVGVCWWNIRRIGRDSGDF